MLEELMELLGPPHALEEREGRYILYRDRYVDQLESHQSFELNGVILETLLDQNQLLLYYMDYPLECLWEISPEQFTNLILRYK